MPDYNCQCCGKSKDGNEGCLFTDKFGETVPGSWECHDCQDQARDMFGSMQTDADIANEERYQ